MARSVTPPTTGWTRRDGDGWTLHLDSPGDSVLAFAASVARGLERQPRELDCSYLYDALGSELYEQITEQPEYYPTRKEDGILARYAEEIRERVGPATVVELGSGSSTKTRRLLDAWTQAGPTRYVPLDISASAVEGACRDLAQRYPGMQIEGIASTYHRGLPLVAHDEPVLLLFLGSTVGNLEPDALSSFLSMLSDQLRAGDHILLGADLVKDEAVLEAAYADAAGLTEKFILNLFGRMNRDLGADVPVDALEMVSYFNRDLARIEMYVRPSEPIEVAVAPLDRRFRIARGEMVLAEISRKFTVDDISTEAARFGLSLEAVYTDDSDWFAVMLFERLMEAGDVPGPTEVLWPEGAVEICQREGRLPVGRRVPQPRRPRRSPFAEWRTVPRCSAQLIDGQDVELAPYRIGAAPVTNREWLSFLLDGGYEQSGLWDPAGWRWRVASSIVAPGNWVLGGGLWRSMWYGTTVALDPLRPVTQVSWWEADAFARWSGARLPTHDEWEVAASWDPGFGRCRPWPWGDEPPSARTANLGQVWFEPAPIGSFFRWRSPLGVHQCLGDVWEWTAEGGLRGGSFATDVTVSCSTRRDAARELRVGFTGVRLARS
ncbi:MAG: L-histidine N-alpha-methyltransferase [Myxococcota bacterium]